MKGDLIQYMLGKAGQNLALNEATLSNQLVRGAVQNLNRLNEQEMDEKYHEMRKAYGLE